MRISLVILFCLCVIAVNSATTRRRVVPTVRPATKAPVKQSAYAYLRTVRGKSSCAGGSCPFWERHGRSFVSLRCFSQQYQECVCLHRMCFSSCMFSRDICNKEMVSCLQQICPRCMPAAQLEMCSAQNGMAQQIATALSTFACYPCCPNMNNNTTKPITSTIIITTGANNPPGTNSIPVSSTPIIPPNGNTNRPTNGANIVGNNRPPNGVNGGNNRPVNSVNGGNNRPVNSGNNRPVNAGNGGLSQGGGNAGGAAAFAGNGNANLNPNVNANAPSQSQKAKKTVRTTIRRVVTTRRTPVTTRRAVPVKPQNKP